MSEGKSFVGIIVASHGDLSKGLVNAAHLICGSFKQVEAITMSPKEGTEVIDYKFREAIKKVDSGSGVLILLDLLGGTPSNVCAQLIRNFNIELICGVNLPMFLEVYLNRNSSDLKTLAKIAEKKGKEGITNLRERIINALIENK